MKKNATKINLWKKKQNRLGARDELPQRALTTQKAPKKGL